MRRIGGLLGSLILVGVNLLVFLVGASRGLACSCPAPAPDEPRPAVIVKGRAGRQTVGPPSPTGPAQPSGWDEAWRFLVEKVERGPLKPGDRIEVRLTRGAGASCGVDLDPLQPGRRYRVGGSYDKARRRLSLNLCTAALIEPLADRPPRSVTVPSSTTPPPTTTPSTTPPPSTSPPAPSSSTTVTVPDTPPPTASDTTEPTLVAVADDGSGGIDERFVGVGVGAAVAAATGAGLLALRRRLGAAPGS